MQRLFFRGKQLENGYKLLDYNINLNDVIQLMIKVNDMKNEAISSDNNVKGEIESNEDMEEGLVEAESLHYKVGDAIDCLDEVHGAWFEAIIQKIFEKEEEKIYNVLWEFDKGTFPFNVSETYIRPRARHLIPFNELSIGQKVMINYNVDEPKQIGLWYDFTIAKVEQKRRLQQLTGTLHIGWYYTFCILYIFFHIFAFMYFFYISYFIYYLYI